MSSTLDNFVLKMPTAQNAFDIFSGLWTSRVPSFHTGNIELHGDGRVLEFEKRLGTFAGLDILELGPLEAMHTLMMHLRGANTITAVEAHQMAYLRCLVVKEAFSLTRARFLLGDFNALLAEHPRSYDYISACGVLYHMSNPIETATYITRRTDRVGIWTHFYDESIKTREGMQHRFSPEPFTLSFEGVSGEAYGHTYKELLDWSGFCGGGEETVTWITLDAWKETFDKLGFDLEIIDIALDHSNGPAMTAFAKRR